MKLKDIKREIAKKIAATASILTVSDVLSGWATLIPNEEHYFVANDGSVRRNDIKAAGGRTAFRATKRQKRKERIRGLKATG